MISASDSKRVVVVLGFHRSGTSMVTRMLNLLGVDLGDERELLEPVELDNPHGYWEPRWMIELNEEILAVLGTSTFAPFRAQPGWERSPALEPLRERARAMLAEHLAGARLWGWKDPRTSLTLPFWREVLDAPPSCIVCVRSPADAIASALKRGLADLDRRTYDELWIEHTALALAHTADEQRLLVFYEDVMRDPAHETQRIAAFLGLANPSPERLAAASTSVVPELRHHATSPWDVAVDASLSIHARMLYLLLRARRSLEPGAGQQAADERLNDALERAGSEVLGEAAGLRETAQAHREAIARRDEIIAELRDAIADRDVTIATVMGSRSWHVTRPLRALGERLGWPPRT